MTSDSLDKLIGGYWFVKLAVAFVICVIAFVWWWTKDVS